VAELMRMPEVAAGATDALLSEWLVGAGAEVAAGDVVAVIETDKAQVEIEAETSGVVILLLAEESHQVEVGAPVALLGTAEEAKEDPAALLAAVGLGSAPSTGSPAPERREVPGVADVADVLVATPAPGAAAPAPSDGARPRQFISPIARRLLRDAGLAGDAITGSGPGGRVVRRDVEDWIAAHAASGSDVEEAPATHVPAKDEDPAPAAAMPAGVGPTAPEARQHSRIRKAVARRLTESKQTVPHFYVKRTARLDALFGVRADLNAHTGRKISVNDFVLRAAADALVSVPEANVVWTDEAMLHHRTADIAVAVASDRGLVTPVLRSVERMSLGAISSEVRSLVERANAGSLKQSDLEGGTLSVTNLGMFGVEEFSAIINPPHSAILAVGAASAQPAVVDGEVTVATVMSLVLSVDHRAIDGALAARWMQALVDALENPYRLLV